MLTPEAPVHYRTTWITLICSMSIVIAMSLALRTYFIWENKRRDRLYGSVIEPSAGEAGKAVEGEKTLDADSVGVPVMWVLPVIGSPISWLTLLPSLAWKDGSIRTVRTSHSGTATDRKHGETCTRITERCCLQMEVRLVDFVLVTNCLCKG